MHNVWWSWGEEECYDWKIKVLSPVVGASQLKGCNHYHENYYVNARPYCPKHRELNKGVTLANVSQSFAPHKKRLFFSQNNFRHFCTANALYLYYYFILFYLLINIIFCKISGFLFVILTTSNVSFWVNIS